MTKKSPFGARVSTEALPTEFMPKEMMNPEEAKFLIGQQLKLDSRPVQNLASFVTTWMEDQADELINDSLTYNLVDQDEYPHIVEIENHCVQMLSNLYHAPEPGAKTFVKVGDKIKKGQTVMIVEAMKTMNHVPSTSDGEISKILVEDGQPVEFGQTLVILK